MNNYKKHRDKYGAETPNLDVARLFLDGSDDRKRLYLNASESVAHEYNDPRFYVPDEIKELVAESLEKSESLSGVLNQLEMKLVRAGGAKIHSIPSFISVVRGYRSFIEEGIFPDDPVEAVVFSEKKFGSLFWTLSRSRKDFGIKV